MDLVLDASVALKIFVDEDGHQFARRLAGQCRFVAPESLLGETANALWKHERYGNISPDNARKAIESLARHTNLIPVTALIGKALTLAIDLGHPVYDCIYLAAALQLGHPIVTADRRFLERLDASIYAGRALSMEEALSRLPLV